MGKYFNLPEMSADEKCIGLANRGAKLIGSIPQWDKIPEGKSLICIGDRPHFCYAAWIYDQIEYREFTSPKHTENQRWLLIDTNLAKELAA